MFYDVTTIKHQGGNNMETITNANVNDYIVNGSWSIAGSMKPDENSTDKKLFTLKVKFNAVSVFDIINKALEPTKIQWVNGVGRKSTDTIESNQTVAIDFKSPGRQPTIDPEVAIINNAKGMDRTERRAYIAELNRKIAELDK